MFSQRFQLPVIVTTHARERMAAREMSEELLLDVIETGVDMLVVGIIGSTSTIRLGPITCCA